MADIIPPFPVGVPYDSYNAVDWYQKVRRAINDATTIRWNQITDFSGSSLAQLATRNYSDLMGKPTGLSVTITTAKLTTGGSNGSMTFTNGLLTAQTAAT